VEAVGRRKIHRLSIVELHHAFGIGRCDRLLRPTVTLAFLRNIGGLRFERQLFDLRILDLERS
jgi:hypothetical protein